VTFQKLGWFLRSRPLVIQEVRSVGRACPPRFKGRARIIDSRRICDSSRDGRIREACRLFYWSAGIAPLPQWHRDRVRGLGPLHRPRGERERGRLGLRGRTSCDDSGNI